MVNPTSKHILIILNMLMSGKHLTDSGGETYCFNDQNEFCMVIWESNPQTGARVIRELRAIPILLADFVKWAAAIALPNTNDLPQNKIQSLK